MLGYCEILAEWLNEVKAARVYVPESPFLHNNLIASNRLHVVADVRPAASVNGTPAGLWARRLTRRAILRMTPVVKPA